MYPVLGPALRGCFVLLLAASGIGKLADMAGFYQIVASYQVFPTALIPFVAWKLVALEIGLAIWLVSGRFMTLAALSLIALHVAYFVWLTVALLRGLAIPNCGCFGVYFARPLTPLTLVEDLLLLLLATTLWWVVKNCSFPQYR